MNLQSFYDSRYQRKKDGIISRNLLFHRADNKSFFLDLKRWGFINKQDSILDAGGGWAIHSKLFKDFGMNVTKIDISEVAISSLEKSKINMIVGDLQSIPLKDSSFDIIFCSQVLEHIPDFELTIKEFYRVLKPNGILILAVPNCYKDMFSFFHRLQKEFDKTGHIHEFCCNMLKDVLEKNMLKVVKSRYHCFLIFWLFALLERRSHKTIPNSKSNKYGFIDKILETVLTYSLIIENSFFGHISKGGMSIQIITKKEIN